MSTRNLFLLAFVEQLRFTTAKGLLTTEDLFKLPLQSTTGKISLDEIAIGINRELKEVGEESFVANRPNPRRVELQLKLDVVKEVIAYVQAENARKRAEADVAAQRAAIKEALAGRAAKDLENLSTEQLEERLKNLGGA